MNTKIPTDQDVIENIVAGVAEYPHGRLALAVDLREQLKTIFAQHQKDVEEAVARERERIAEWAKSNARTKDTMMSDFEENHEWTVDYHELLDALTLPTEHTDLLEVNI